MKSWQLTLRQAINERVDASPIRLSDFDSLSVDQVRAIELSTASGVVSVGDLFDVAERSDSSSTLLLCGDLSVFDHVADRHRDGVIRVEGNVGQYAASSMSGGLLEIAGDVGSDLGAAHGHDRLGMGGGRVVVGGSAGDNVGHRMRRGELFIEGDVGDSLGSFMIAGTIAIGGTCGRYAGFGMSRGTLIMESMPDHPYGRFSQPFDFRSPYLGLLKRSTQALLCDGRLRDLLSRLETWAIRSRGDAAVAGQGEIIAFDSRHFLRK